MTRSLATIALFPILAVVSVSAQTVTPQTANAPAAHESLVPRCGDLLLSTGPAIGISTIAVPDSVYGNRSATTYGGYVALDYFVTNALSLVSELTVVNMGGGTNLIATVLRRGSPFLAVVLKVPDQTLVLLDVGARFYPLQLTEYQNFRLQPFAKVVIGGMFPILSATGLSASADPCPFIRAGAGADFAFNPRWSATAEADCYTSLTDSAIHTIGFVLPTREYGVLATAGIRYRF
jgi:hypothetical protein